MFQAFLTLRWTDRQMILTLVWLCQALDIYCRWIHYSFNCLIEIKPFDVFQREDSEQHLKDGHLTLSGLQVRGNAFFSHRGLPLNSETLEYSWLLEVTIGDISGRLTAPQVGANLIKINWTGHRLACGIDVVFWQWQWQWLFGSGKIT